MCKKLITVVMVGFIIAGFTSILQASEMLNFTYSGNGARAGAMGYAFTGIADDATAIAWNAAGLTQLYSMEACAIGRFGFGSWSVDNEYVTDINTSSKFQLNFLSFVFPFKAGDYNIVGGLALRNIFDFNDKLTVEYSTEDPYERTQKGGVYAISPAIAVQVNDMISVGATFNIYYGSHDLTVNEEGIKTEYASSDFSGTSFDLGIMVKPNDQFSIGANLNFPYTLTRDVEDVEEYEIDVPFFFSVGAAFKATDQLTLAFDYHSRTWSNSNIFEDADYDTDLNSIHAGLEYLMTSGDSVIPLRLGYYSHPIHDWDHNQDQVVNSVFTLGAGLVMNNFVLDGAFEFEPASIEYKNIYTEETYTLDQNNFRITLGGTFHFGN
jgi:long-subunit fatty acid transport protein